MCTSAKIALQIVIQMENRGVYHGETFPIRSIVIGMTGSFFNDPEVVSLFRLLDGDPND